MQHIYDPEVAIKKFAKRSPLTLEANCLTNGRGLYADNLTPYDFANRVGKEIAEEGDSALIRISSALDGENLDFIEVTPDIIAKAKQQLPKEIIYSLDYAADNIASFQHQAMPRDWADNDGQRGEIVCPLSSTGIYVPGGTAPLMSTVLMCAIPAHVAGVKEIYLTSPASGSNLPHPGILYAASIANVSRVFKLGGTQAIAAFALGTETVPKVDLVCGPGNIFVTTAKRAFFGTTGIDGLYGPTETTILADESANASWVAADLTAQAEHDPLATPVLISLSEQFASEVEKHIADQLKDLPRRKIAAQALANHGYLVVVNSLADALRVIDSLAPEHLCVDLRNPPPLNRLGRSSGGVFMGRYSPEALADYVAGPSHVMPTARTARFSSALSVRNFIKNTPFLQFNKAFFKEQAPYARNLAELEDLSGHARALEIRTQDTTIGTENSSDTAPSAEPHKPHNRTGNVQDNFKLMMPKLAQYQGVEPSERLAIKAGIPLTEVIRLNSNENPFGALPEVSQALSEAPLNLYPDPKQVQLRQALAEYTGFPPEMIVAGAGADEIIDLLLRLFTEPGDSILDFPPTFGMYNFVAKVTRVNVVASERDANWEIDVRSLTCITPDVKVIFAASPNNPTGNLLPTEDAVEILKTGALLAVDETYYEFCEQSLAHLLDQYSNLIILRSFSKWAGIAGLRIGYAIGAPAVIEGLMQIKQPYNINAAAEVAVCTSLQHKSELLSRVRELIAQRQRLEQFLMQRDNVSYWPSQGNFLLCEFNQHSANDIYIALASQGIFVRKFTHRSLAKAVRISTGNEFQTDRLLAALTKILSK